MLVTRSLTQDPDFLRRGSRIGVRDDSIRSVVRSGARSFVLGSEERERRPLSYVLRKEHGRSSAFDLKSPLGEGWRHAPADGVCSLVSESNVSTMLLLSTFNAPLSTDLMPAKRYWRRRSLYWPFFRSCEPRTWTRSVGTKNLGATRRNCSYAQ